MNEQLLNWLAVAIGSAIGGLARYGITVLAARLWGEAFPWGTLGINVVGSLIIGLFFTLTLSTGAMPASTNTKLFVMTGICGGFTTFSAFSLQTLQLLEEREYGPALYYILASVFLCVGAAALGYWIGSAAKVPEQAEGKAEQNVFLAAVPGIAALPACLNAASELAPAFGKPRLMVLHLRQDPDQFVATSEEVLSSGESLAFRAETKRRADELRAALSDWDRNPHTNGRAEVLELTTYVAAALNAHAKATRLVIMNKLPPGASFAEREAQTAALFEIRKPVLIVPKSWAGTVGKRPCIAWKPVPQAERAIKAAAPIFRQAEQIAALAGGTGEARLSLHALLRGLGIATDIEEFDSSQGNAGETILKRAGDYSSDLLIMGAYGHGRLAEFVFGGVTHYVLNHANLPILMAH
jgi:fluoride exporter